MRKPPFDKFVQFIVGLGIPGLVLLYLLGTTTLVGAAALTSSLAFLGGPIGGMITGIAALGLLGYLSSGLAKYGFERVMRAVLLKHQEKGQTKEEIFKTIDSYPISSDLKAKLKQWIRDNWPFAQS